ncbi:protein FAR1-RELATED SEQUENCE 7-like [Macadamia integrifolia]|uniref:protein FAR1-RELATED SEQUENCE 7-like n=1 Tax=Macadamia integrifolia TaxID=60698 RepID=UPI001C4FDD34|nr:protein FAR1-RELATED SEQUENCE 7-like [Macadamia integrifolia]XP_042514594.1 protein FAR1-RELATED SEQUENCE 7-like [Macadamia integrifolia]
MVTLASSINMEDYAMVRSTWFYMETEDVYGTEELSDIEKAIEVHATELEPQLEDECVETQQSATSEHLHSDDEGIEDAIDFEEENDQQLISGGASKDASEAGTTFGSTDETEILPHVGMKFVDLKAAYSFYSHYARMKGFGVRIDRTNLSRKREPDGSRQVLSKRFVCYKEGFRNDNRKRQRGKEVRHRAEVRVGCPAFIVVKVASDGWVVDKFEANHNHPLVFPGQTIKLLYFGEENDQQTNSDNALKDAIEAGKTCGRTDEKEILPYVGMKFVDLKAAYSFYSYYARMKGFGVRIDRTNLSRKREPDGSRQVLSKRFVCYKEGFRNDNHKRQRGKEVRHRAEVRVGCPAFIVVKVASDGWVVDKFEPNHNHPMIFPGQTFRLRSPEHLMDKSYMKRNERKMIAVDCQAVLTYFDSMQVRDPGFIYSIKVSDDGMVSGIFWADSKARSAYEVFDDVAVFDITYKTNRYRWPFGLFTGVNNNAQSVLFGCGLVANETKESFEWLFKAWMNAMGDKAPKAIITDECIGIIPSVGSVFPKTLHRFCSWHIAKHAQEHLGALWCQNLDFKKEWKECIYRSWTKEDFLAQWEAMMLKYNLKDHSWLSEKFAQKEYWVPSYLRGSFFAGLSSTRQSEEMNSYFRGYFNDNMTLCRFVKQYERAVTRRREKEADAEFRIIPQLPRLSSQSPLEEHAGKVYTRKVFEIFKKHFNASLSLSAHEELAEGPVRKFKVGPFKVPNEQRCMVEYNSLEEEVRCSCYMFEFMGLVCKHVLKVLQMVDRDNIPSKYILFRWTNEARPGLPVDNILDNAPTTITISSVWGLSHAIRNMMAMACSSPECCEVAMGTLQGLTEKLSTMVQNATGVGVADSTTGTQKSTIETMPVAHKHLNIPPPSVNCDQSSQVDQKNPMEQSIEKGKNRCSICRSTGHNKTKCEAVNKETGEPELKRALVGEGAL